MISLIIDHCVSFNPQYYFTSRPKLMDEEQSISLLAQPHVKGPASDPQSSPPPSATSTFHRIYSDSKLRVVFLIVVIWSAYVNIFGEVFPSQWRADRYVPAACVQVDPLRPSVNSDVASHLASVYQNGGFSSRAADWLGGAVRIP